MFQWKIIKLGGFLLIEIRWKLLNDHDHNKWQPIFYERTLPYIESKLTSREMFCCLHDEASSQKFFLRRGFEIC
jgi:hypothetical protein